MPDHNNSYWPVPSVPKPYWCCMNALASYFLTSIQDRGLRSFVVHCPHVSMYLISKLMLPNVTICDEISQASPFHFSTLASARLFLNHKYSLNMFSKAQPVFCSWSDLPLTMRSHRPSLTYCKACKSSKTGWWIGLRTRLQHGSQVNHRLRLDSR